MRNLSGPGPVTARGECSQAPRLEARPCPPVSPVPSAPVPSAPSTQVGHGVLLCWLTRSLPRVRYKILPARLLGGQNGTKLSLHAETAPNRAISGEQGEFCTAHAVRRGVQGEFCPAHAVRGGVQGEFCTEAARHGSCWARFVSSWHLPCVQLSGFRHPPALHPGPWPLQRARHWWRWGFCSIRSWLAACRRRVAPLMLQFPPLGGGAPSVRGGGAAYLASHTPYS